MAGVEFIGAGETYVNGTQAVHPPDLAIDDGKTTLLRMLAGLEVVTEGEIRLGDRQFNDVHPRDRDIAMVLQNCALYLHMTVTANIGFPPRQRGVPKKEISAKVEVIVGMLESSDYLDRKPRKLSGGQPQRVAVFDKGVLHRLTRHTTSASGPTTLLVGGFIGSPSMNLLEARLVATDHGFALDVGSVGRLPLGDAIRHRYLSLADHVGGHHRRRYPTRGSGTDCAGWPSTPGRGRVRRAGGLRVPLLARVAGPNELVGSLSDGLRRGPRQLGKRSETRGTAAGEGVEFP